MGDIEKPCNKHDVPITKYFSIPNIAQKYLSMEHKGTGDLVLKDWRDPHNTFTLQDFYATLVV